MEGSAGGGGQMKGPSRRDFGPQQQGGGMMRRPPGGAAAAAHAHAQAHAQAQGMMGPMMGPGGNASHPQQVGLSVCLRACEVRRFRCNDSGLEGIPGLQGSNAVLDCVQNASPGHMCTTEHFQMLRRLCTKSRPVKLRSRRAVCRHTKYSVLYIFKTKAGFGTILIHVKSQTRSPNMDYYIVVTDESGFLEYKNQAITS